MVLVMGKSWVKKDTIWLLLVNFFLQNSRYAWNERHVDTTNRVPYNNKVATIDLSVFSDIMMSLRCNMVTNQTSKNSQHSNSSPTGKPHLLVSDASIVTLGIRVLENMHIYESATHSNANSMLPTREMNFQKINKVS